MSEILTKVPSFNPGDVVKRHRLLANGNVSKRPEAGEYEVLAHVNGDYYHLVKLADARTFTLDERYLRLVRKAAVPKAARRVYGHCAMGHNADLGTNADGSHYNFCERCLST